jgi:hypothetical protein
MSSTDSMDLANKKLERFFKSNVTPRKQLRTTLDFARHSELEERRAFFTKYVCVSAPQA